MLPHCPINNFQSVAFSEFFPDVSEELLWGPALGLGVLSLIVIVATKGRLGYTGGVDTKIQSAASIRDSAA